MAIKYFIYSQDQYNEKNTVLKARNKEFVPGIIVVDGTKKNFTALSLTPTLERFVDSKIIAQGDPDSFVYSMPKTVKRASDM